MINLTKCVRCNLEFENNSHPLAHFFTICPNCRKKSEETIHDQNTYNLKIMGVLN